MIAAETEKAIPQGSAAWLSASEPLLVTISSACSALGVSQATIWRLLDRQELESVLIGRRRLIRYESVKALAAKGTRQ